jgi:hypothetical protein
MVTKIPNPGLRCQPGEAAAEGGENSPTEIGLFYAAKCGERMGNIGNIWGIYGAYREYMGNI